MFGQKVFYVDKSLLIINLIWFHISFLFTVKKSHFQMVHSHLDKYIFSKDDDDDNTPFILLDDSHNSEIFTLFRVFRVTFCQIPCVSQWNVCATLHSNASVQIIFAFAADSHRNEIFVFNLFPHAKCIKRQTIFDQIFITFFCDALVAYSIANERSMCLGITAYLVLVVLYK